MDRWLFREIWMCRSSAWRLFIMARFREVKSPYPPTSCSLVFCNSIFKRTLTWERGGEEMRKHYLKNWQVLVIAIVMFIFIFALMVHVALMWYKSWEESALTEATFTPQVSPSESDLRINIMTSFALNVIRKYQKKIQIWQSQGRAIFVGIVNRRSDG